MNKSASTLRPSLRLILSPSYPTTSATICSTLPQYASFKYCPTLIASNWYAYISSVSTLPDSASLATGLTSVAKSLHDLPTAFLYPHQSSGLIGWLVPKG